MNPRSANHDAEQCAPDGALTGNLGTGSNLSDRVGRLGLGAFDLGLRLSS
jgi:hypothetical protein